MLNNKTAYIALAGIFAAALLSLVTRVAVADAARISVRQELADPPVPSAANGLSLVAQNSGADAAVPFRLNVDFRCADPEARRQMLVSVADTVTLIDANGLPAPQTVQIEVPLRQLQWLLPAKTCRDLRDAEAYWAGDGVRYFRLRSRATAFVTLTCTGVAEGPEIAIATTPVDVWLSCDTREPPADEAEDAALTAPGSAAGN